MPKNTSHSLQGQCPAPGDKDADKLTVVNMPKESSLQGQCLAPGIKEVDKLTVKQLSHTNTVQSLKVDTGRKLIIGNFNYSSEPHEMTESRQNKVENWVGIMITENRISGNHLNDDHPGKLSLMEMENRLCLPNMADHKKQRLDYISICARIAVKYIKCLQFLENVAVNPSGTKGGGGSKTTHTKVFPL